MERSNFLSSLIATLLFAHLYSISMANLAMETPKTNISTDKHALLALKSYTQNDPKSIMTNNWSPKTSVCDWIGVTCDARRRSVRSLDLSYMSLAGTIPPHLGNMSFLSELSLRNNSFHGTLPVELSHLRRLKSMNLGFNSFTGEIPSWLGFMPNLQSLRLHGNQFSGSIPASIFKSTSLKLVQVNHNPLSGNVWINGNLTSMKFLRREEIPKEIGSNLKLEALSFEEIFFESFMPYFVYNASSLNERTSIENSLMRGNNFNNDYVLCDNLTIKGIYVFENVQRRLVFHN